MYKALLGYWLTFVSRYKKHPARYFILYAMPVSYKKIMDFTLMSVAQDERGGTLSCGRVFTKVSLQQQGSEEQLLRYCFYFHVPLLVQR